MAVVAPAGSPPGYDFPDVRALLKGHTELANVQFTKRVALGRLQLEVRSVDMALYQKLVKAFPRTKTGPQPAPYYGGGSAFGDPVTLEL